MRWRGIAPIYPSRAVHHLPSISGDDRRRHAAGVISASRFLRILARLCRCRLLRRVLGVLMGMSRLVARIPDPWIAALYPLPKISLIPLLIIWLGTGETYIITISAITAFFPIVISTYSGIRQTDRGPDQSGARSRRERAAGADEGDHPRRGSEHHLGLQLGMGVTIILVVAAEMIGGSNQSGMGYLLVHYGQVMETEKVFASLLVLAVFGGIIMKTQALIDRTLAPWAIGKS